MMPDLVLSETVVSTGADAVAQVQPLYKRDSGLNLPLAGALVLHLVAGLLLASGLGGKRELPPRVYPIRLYNAAEVAVVSSPAARQPPTVMPDRGLPSAPPAPLNPAATPELRMAAPPAADQSPEIAAVPAPQVVTAAVAPVALAPAAVEPVPMVGLGQVATPVHSSPRSGPAGTEGRVNGNPPGPRPDATPTGGGSNASAAGVAGPPIAAPVAPLLVLAHPLYRENPAPEYPPLARRRGLEGTAVLEVLVNVDGRAGELQLQHSSGHQLLDEAALRAVKTWRFEPGRRGAAPVAMKVLVPVRFGLR